MFSKPMFSALNIVTCSSAISKGFFQSHLCGNHSFCDGYESPVRVPEKKEKNKPNSDNDCDSNRGIPTLRKLH